MLPELTIKGKSVKLPIIQGGMGIGVSLSPLASAVAAEGGIGIVSSACLDRLLGKRNNKVYSTYDAVYEEVCLSREKGGVSGINIMVAIARDYDVTVKAAIDAKVDVIISGGGLPLTLPGITNPGETALVPIVSSVRALEVIYKKWERLGYRPDAVVLEGPLAGGHLGFKVGDLGLESNKLENLFPPIKDFASRHGDIPVIVAGGIYDRDDIARFLAMGADGVQMGTRFLATVESSATEAYKHAVVNAGPEDILVASSPGSPCGMPFMVIKESPMFVSALNNRRKPRCDKGYIMMKNREGRYAVCKAQEDRGGFFCICNGLLSSGGYNMDAEEPLYTVGVNGCRVDRISTVRDVMDELRGVIPATQIRSTEAA
ncbi:MAG: nitronate monooxygenase [Syntrophorhabdaceae bacterium]|nr:nitronate monooxygenase [Syntrophorhabdaceae bacterium]